MPYIIIQNTLEAEDVVGLGIGVAILDGRDIQLQIHLFNYILVIGIDFRPK